MARPSGVRRQGRTETTPHDGDTDEGREECGSRRTGGWGLIGLLSDIMTDEEIDEMVEAIYAARERDIPRDIDPSEWE